MGSRVTRASQGELTAAQARKVGPARRCSNCGATVRDVPSLRDARYVVDAKPQRMVVLHAQATLFGDPHIVGTVRYAYRPHECSAP